MPDRKNTGFAANLNTDVEAHSDKLTSTVVLNDAAANDANGWAHYREWISKAPAPRGRRAGIDPALYTWKGYRKWSEQVKRDWSPDQADDFE